MIISEKVNENKNEKIKAYFNIEIGDYQIKGFKLYEDEKKKLKMIMPNMMLKDKDGNIIKDENTEKPINMQIVQINQELSNSKKLFENMEKILVDTYNENLGKKNEEIKPKEIEIPDLEKGKLNVSSFNTPKEKSKTANNDIQLKSNNSIFIGAFKVKHINLFYNTLKNDYSISMPQYEYTNKDGIKANNSFLVPKNKEAHTLLKSMVISSYKNKIKEYKAKINSKNFNQGFNQNNKQEATQAPTIK